jgi:hypothetical protein
MDQFMWRSDHKRLINITVDDVVAGAPVGTTDDDGGGGGGGGGDGGGNVNTKCTIW